MKAYLLPRSPADDLPLRNFQRLRTDPILTQSRGAIPLAALNTLPVAQQDDIVLLLSAWGSSYRVQYSWTHTQ